MFCSRENKKQGDLRAQLLARPRQAVPRMRLDDCGSTNLETHDNRRDVRRNGARQGRVPTAPPMPTQELPRWWATLLLWADERIVLPTLPVGTGGTVDITRDPCNGCDSANDLRRIIGIWLIIFDAR